MDVDGIWRYFGNYSFFGAPFIWTTLHGAMYCFQPAANVVRISSSAYALSQQHCIPELSSRVETQISEAMMG
jgi:hypothetical protein